MILGDDFKTQQPVDRRFSWVLTGFYCSKPWQLPGTGWNCRSTGISVLKSTLGSFYIYTEPIYTNLTWINVTLSRITFTILCMKYFFKVSSRILNRSTYISKGLLFNPNLPGPVNFVPFGTMRYSPFDINLISITCILFVYLYFCLFLNKA